MEELGRPGVAAGRPDALGRLPLMEAVKTRRLDFVTTLIQHGASANGSDPATGAKPIMLAFQLGMHEVCFM